MKTLKILVLAAAVGLLLLSASSKWLWTNRESAIITTLAELNFMHGVTSNVQTQLNNKGDISTAVDATTLFSSITGSVHKVVVSNVQLNNTGNTNENTVLTATIPANSIGTNGSFHITMLINQTNNANAKTIRVKFNGTQVAQAGVVSCACFQSYAIIRNRNSLSSQVSMYSASAASGAFVSGTSGAVSTYSINTAADITVTVTIQNAVAGDAAAIEAFEILAVK